MVWTAPGELTILPRFVIFLTIFMPRTPAKQNAACPIDKDFCRSVIQAQVKSVLGRENPSGFANVRFQRGGTFVPIIQVDEVLPGDAFVYLFIAIASQEYFQQKADWENRKNVLPIEVNTDDEDF